MTSHSRNFATKLSPEDFDQGPNPDLRGPKDSQLGLKFDRVIRELCESQKTARKCLSCGHAGTKEWSIDLGVADRVVRRWASGDQLIPKSRIPQIIMLYHSYRMKSRDLDAEIDAAIDEMLAQAYGPGGGHSM